MVFLVVMCGCQSWARKNSCFWTMVLEKILESPLNARRSNQSILKEINPEHSLEGLMLKLQYFDYLLRRADSLEKVLMLVKTESRKKRQQRMMRWLNSITDSVHMSLSNSRRRWRTGKPAMLQFMELQRGRHNLVTKQQQKPYYLGICFIFKSFMHTKRGVEDKWNK